ncbi:MAG: hypothetical protein ACKO4A_00270 [Gammaproteobacteria bacterium]
MISRFQHPFLRAFAGALVLVLLLLVGATHRESPNEPTSDVECVLCASGGHAAAVAPVVVVPAPAPAFHAESVPSLILPRAQPLVAPPIRGPPVFLAA